MWKDVRNALLVSVFATQAACAAGANPIRPEMPHAGGGTEIRREQLGTGVSLLTSLGDRVVGLGVMRGATGCPILSMRARGTLIAADQPAVYVNGARVRDSCVLDMIPTSEVEPRQVFVPCLGSRHGGVWRWMCAH